MADEQQQHDAAPLTAAEIEALTDDTHTVTVLISYMEWLHKALADGDAKLDAYREIVAAVATFRDDDWPDDYCPFCDSMCANGVEHAADCPVTRARTLLGTPPPDV